MKDQVRRLHEWRQEKVAIDAEIKQHRDACEDSLAELLAARGALEIGIKVSEAELKTQRVAEYDGADKAMHFGIGIREDTILHYDKGMAFDWAVAHNMALQLDAKTFVKIAKTIGIDFVNVTKVPKATIATDLSKYVEGE